MEMPRIEKKRDSLAPSIGIDVYLVGFFFNLWIISDAFESLY